MKINFLRTIPKVFLLWLLIAVQACDNDPTPEIPVGADGYFVVNEGAFGKSNTSISFYDRSTNVMTNDVFVKKNARPLGDQAQSVTVFEGKAYIVVQNSGKVEVINADDYSSVKTISDGIVSPRYFLAISSSKAYLSDWGTEGVNGSVLVIDLTTLTVTKTIDTPPGANKMLLRDGKVYVANNGGYSESNTISIIDTSTDAISGSIEVGVNPNSMQFDKDGNLWVIGIGNYFDVAPVINKIGTDNKVSLTLDLPEVTYVGSSLAINNAGDKIYFNYNGGVYAMSTSATTLPATALINKDFYGLAVDPITDEIIGTEALDFSSPGKIYVYSAAGTEVRTNEVGIAPSGVAFK